MTVQPEVVALLADVLIDPAAPLREWTHFDGRTITSEEADLIGRATPDDLRAVVEFMEAQMDLSAQQQADRDRFAAIVTPTWKRLPADSAMADVLAALPAAERAEALDLAERLFPDGYVYPHGGGPHL